MDHWPLFCGIGNLARYVTIMDLLRATLGVPGHVAEFGTWHGSTLMLLTKLLRIFDPHGSKVVHCFDSFEGLTAFHAADGEAQAGRGSYRGDQDMLMSLFELYGVGDDIEIHKGLIEDTLPPLMQQRPELSFSFVYCDTDLYASTKLILDELHPRLSVGGVFVFDEWNHAGYPGETVAVREFLQSHGDSYAAEHVMHARQPSLVLRRKR